VLAAMLMDGDAIMRAAEYVNDTMFYAERHRRIFRALVAITERGAVADPLTLADGESARVLVAAMRETDLIEQL